MSKQNESITLIDEIIDNASQLPLECQDWLLAIAKGSANFLEIKARVENANN